MSNPLRAICVALALGLAPGAAPAQPHPRQGSILLKGGDVVDGVGAPARPADVLIRGDRIVAVGGRAGSPPRGATVIDVRGMIVAPGFIDLHAHVSEIDKHPRAENFTRQGITTIFNSLHGQDLPWPFDTYTASVRMAPNVAYVAGHNWARKTVMGMEDRAPTPAELARMQGLVDTVMKQGGFGLGTGLEYIPSAYSKTDEVVALAKVAARYGGIYVTHIRDEGPRVVESVEEAIKVGREAHIPVQINHFKLAGLSQWGWSVKTLALVDKARAEGVNISIDLYPYDAFSTVSDILFPPWALAGGPGSLARRAADPATRTRLRAEMKFIFPQQTGKGLESVQLRDFPQEPAFKGKTLADYAAAKGYATTPDGVADLLIDLQLKGGFTGIFHSMSEEDIERILAYPGSMIDTDADLVEPDGGFPHPRSYGAFPRVIARYVRERHVLTLEQAIHKMTQMPAARLGLADRGVVGAGKIADIVVFDPKTFGDQGTFADPNHYAVGVRQLLVGGVLVIRDGAETGALPGRVLRHRVTDRLGG